MKKDMYVWMFLIVLGSLSFQSCQLRDARFPSVEQWTTYEITIEAEEAYENPYTEVEVWAWFVNQSGDSLVRPAFWDGGNIWKIRFAPSDAGDIWSWNIYTNVNDEGLQGSGKLKSVAYTGQNKLEKHGLLRMSPGKRNVVYADGTSFLLVGDTPWSLPYRATPEQVKIYAKDRQEKGFNTSLLIAVQPDIYAEGPDTRNTEGGFARGFYDIPDQHMNLLNPAYFQILDTLTSILHEHEILPVFAPLAHGYGWIGQIPLGGSAKGDEFARFVKYLLARYGSRPAIWLLSLDGNGEAPGIVPAGEMLEEWDAYQQPTGLHYNPFDDYLAAWAVADSSLAHYCMHFNKKHQDKDWLDFQWAQTGHDGKHLYHKVERLYDEKPVKAVMNGEATYEGMAGGKNGLGWWQGVNAWGELMHGGTMGVVYGAVSLWQWKITQDEAGWEDWTDAPYTWREALDFEGGQYVGAISRCFEGFDFYDMEKRWDLTGGTQPLLAKEGVFYISYMDQGGKITIKGIPDDLPTYWFDPVKGEFYDEEAVMTNGSFISPSNDPWVFVAGERVK